MREGLRENQLQSQWSQVCEGLRRTIGEAEVRSWVSPLALGDLNGGTLTLFAPSSFIKSRVVAEYMDAILQSWRSANSNVQHISIAVNDNLSRSVEKVEFPEDKLGQITSGGQSTNEIDVLNAHLDKRYTFDEFVVGKSNEVAYASARRVAEFVVNKSNDVSYAAARRAAENEAFKFNPLFLYGGVGLGKTHLMHAIAWYIRQNRPDRRTIYVSAEKFMYQFVRALRYKDTVAFKEQFRSVDVLMIDDVQFISGKETTQEEFFYTLNALVDKDHQVIISADKSPSDLEGIEDRLKSRLAGGLAVDIHPTTYELRLGILHAKAERLGTFIPKEVTEFLAHKIVSNVRELEGALNRIVAHSTLVGREISLDTAHEVLRDLLRANDKRVSIEDIQKRVAEFFGIKVSDMQSARRSQNIARPRQVAMFLSKTLTTRSLPEIGRKFGGRDHTTVLHAVKKIRELQDKDPEFAKDLEILTRTLAN